MPSILVCNPRSLNNKVDKLGIILNENQIDLAAITETWFSTEAPMGQFSIEGYNLFSQPRKDRRAGGVALYVKDHIIASPMRDITVPDDIEAIWTSVRPYRLPRPINNWCYLLSTKE